MGVGIDEIDGPVAVGDEELVVEPCHGVGVGLGSECAGDLVGLEVEGVDGAVLVTDEEGVVGGDHGVDWSAAGSSEGDGAGIGVELMDDSEWTSEEDDFGLCCACKSEGGEGGDDLCFVFHDGLSGVLILQLDLIELRFGTVNTLSLVHSYIGRESLG